jgi:YNFM family putative membrane transporter
MKHVPPDEITADAVTSGQVPAAAAPATIPMVPPLEAGTPEFRHAVMAIAAAGFGTFLMLYCTQPLMPVFTAVFGVSPAASSLSLSVATGSLAPMLLISGMISDKLGRRGVIIGSLLASGVFTAAAAFAGGFTDILILRLLAGIALSGVPAIAMAYLAEECHPRGIGMVTGMLIGGNALGGMTGRLTAGTLADFASWRWSLGVIGVTGVVLGIVAWRLLPPSRRFTPSSIAPAALARSFRAQLPDKALLMLFFLAFVLMGGFVTIYNYISYRLLSPEFGLSHTAVGAIFALYLVGIAASLTMGRLGDRIGRARSMYIGIAIMMAGVALTMSNSLAVIILGIAAVTFGFFGAHTVASGWLAVRAKGSRAQAAAIYMVCYYAGSSGIGTLAGIAWPGAGWPAIAALVGVLLAAALGAARVLSSAEAK